MLQSLINKYVNDPRDPKTNLDLGKYYDELGQNASAISFYLRAAELTEDKHLAYDCIVRNFLLIDNLTRRSFSARGQIFHAIALLPERPEAYFHLSRLYEQKQEWLEMYATTIQAKTFKRDYTRSTDLNLDYPGDYALDFQKGVAAWWINRGDEAGNIFKYLLDTYNMRHDFKAGCVNNLKRIGRHTEELEN